MNKNNYTLFWNGVFSNWYPSKFYHNGISFTCGEQYMMYHKAMTFNDKEVAKLIMETSSPKEQKRLGRLVSNYNDEKWAAVRVQVMVDGLYEKFNTNPVLKAALLETGDTIIAEASPVDKIWGIGLAEDDPRAWDMATWKGQNLLGIVLMMVRDKLKCEAI
jgi:ribA/ribD-fused uncharacterized protein